MEDINYNTNPVSGFGLKLLKKLGYVEGKGIGKNASEDIPVIFNQVPRADRLGLGASETPETIKRSRLDVGTTVKVMEGHHKGIIGTVGSFLYKLAVIELAGNSETLKVPIEYLEPHDIDDIPTNTQVSTKRKLRWVVPGLKVRVKNKQRQDLYGQKVIVNDVLDQFSFTVLVNGRIIDDLSEKDIQTVIPNTNSYVLVLDQQLAGRIVSRNKSSNAVVVTALDTQEVVETTQSNVCEYVLIQ